MWLLPGLVFVVVGIVVLSPLVVIPHLNAQRRGQWRDAADRLGVEFVEGKLLSFDEMQGSIGDVAIEVARIPDGSQRATPVTRFRTSFRDLPVGFELRREHMLDGAAKLLRGEDVQVGDPLIDPTFLLRGTRGHVRAALSQRARLLMMELGTMGTLTAEGDNLALWSSPKSSASRDIEGTLQSLVELTKLLSVPQEQISARLLANVIADADEGVRLASLGSLAEEYPDSTQLQSALRSASKDADESVRNGALRVTLAAREGVSEEELEHRLGGACPSSRNGTERARSRCREQTRGRCRRWRTEGFRTRPRVRGPGRRTRLEDDGPDRTHRAVRRWGGRPLFIVGGRLPSPRLAGRGRQRPSPLARAGLQRVATPPNDRL